MGKEQVVLTSIIIYLLLGCSTPPTPTPLIVQSSTPLVQPTLTASLILTSEPATPTSEPSLRTNGPYFAYFREVPGRSDLQFVLMDADAGGRKVIDIPDEITDSLSNYWLGMRYVSPDGKWMAFYTGYAGEVYKEPKQSTFDLTLKLLNFETGEIQVVTPLLSQDYPENFANALNEINDSSVRPESLQNAFLAGITQALAWSPDGRYLAFAGQVEGLSSDLYLYDMTTKNIQRLSDDHEELQSIRWSSDGKWILHEGGFSTDIMVEKHISAVAVDDSSVRDLGNVWRSYWLNSHEILTYRSGIERYQLRLVNLDTGNSTEIWEGYFGGYEVDPTGTWVVLDAISSTIPPKDEKPGFVHGSIQLIKLNSFETIQTIHTPDPLLYPLDLFLRTNDGKVVGLPGTSGMILASPDQKYWAAVIERDIKIYDQDLNLVTEVSSLFQNMNILDVPWSPDDMQWSPDASALFLVYGTDIYHIDRASGALSLVEENLPSSYWLDSGWINGQ
jgi:Tol biopolymer transport system component